jgi:hypothetical protein
MKHLVTLLVLFMACPSPSQVRTLTRTVVQFGDLEGKIASATGAEERGAYISEDFEERRCAEPGTPIPRDEWLAAPAQKFSFHQQAVHDYGNIAIYSALANDENAQFMVVDTWEKEGDSWKLATRYLCAASGEKPASTLPKRY